MVSILIHHAVRGALKHDDEAIFHFMMDDILIHHAVRGALKLPSFKMFCY
jgi:hypothetical protein